METDLRYDVPLYGIREAAMHIGMSDRTLGRWASRDNLLTVLPPSSSRGARLPFIALAEAQFYSLLRRDGLTLQAITEGMTAVRDELGPRMLQQDRLAHDGRDILINLGGREAEWERARDRQGGIAGVIERALTPIRWDSEGFPEELRLVAYGDANVVANPRYAFGQPIVANGARIEDVLDLFDAGDSIETVANEFNLTLRDVEAVLRGRAAAA